MADGELRTYVTVTTGGTARCGSGTPLDDEGGIGGAEVDRRAADAHGRARPAAARFRPDDPTGTGPDVTVRFAAGTLTITGPAGHDGRPARP